MKSNFRARLRYLIDQKKISQAVFARGINVNSTRVTEWLKGDVKKKYWGQTTKKYIKR